MPYRLVAGSDDGRVSLMDIRRPPAKSRVKDPGILLRFFLHYFLSDCIEFSREYYLL